MAGGRGSTARDRIEKLRERNPVALELALVCALAVRIERPLLRSLRLLLPAADAGAEADLWLSDLVIARDAVSMTLDPLVADLLRAELAARTDPDRRRTAGEAWQCVEEMHVALHWSVRLEERIRYLDARIDPDLRGQDVEREIGDLLLAAVDRLTRERNPRGLARWLLGAIRRLPSSVADSAAARAGTTAAEIRVDRGADPVGRLSAGEAQTWLPWMLSGLGRVSVPVQLREGAVVLGAVGSDTVNVEVADTDPLVLEVLWNDGTSPRQRRVSFRVDDPVTVETGTDSVRLVSLGGDAVDLSFADDRSAGLSFDDVKAGLRPCLAREDETALALDGLGWAQRVALLGPAGIGTSTLLVSVCDRARAAGYPVIEHFFGVRDPAFDERRSVEASLVTQLQAVFGPRSGFDQDQDHDRDQDRDLAEQILWFSGRSTFTGRPPLVIALDGLDQPGHEDIASWMDELLDATAYRAEERSPGPVVLLMSSSKESVPADIIAGRRNVDRSVVLTVDSGAEVCAAMVERDREELTLRLGWTGPSLFGEEKLISAVDRHPAAMARLIAWIRSRPLGDVDADHLPVVLTKDWDSFRSGLEERNAGRIEVYLDVLRAAHARNTLTDCAEAVAVGTLGDDLALWSDFWSAAVEARIVELDQSGLIRLVVPQSADLLADLDQVGDFCLGRRDERLAEVARSGTRTRVDTVTRHTLDAGELDNARQLVTEAELLRRRYVENPAGLLTDLKDLARASHDPEIETLHDCMQYLVRKQVPVIDFLTRLHSMLVERGLSRLLPTLTEARPEATALLAPLRVSQVVDDTALSRSRWVRAVSDVIGIAALPGRQDEDVLLCTQGLITTMNGYPLPTDVDLGSLSGMRGQPAGVVVWTEAQVKDLFLGAELETTRDVEYKDDVAVEGVLESGPPQFVARLARGILVADEWGRIDWFSALRSRARPLIGHVGAVVGAVDGPPDVDCLAVTAGADGTVRAWSTSAGCTVMTGHRSAVCQLARLPDGGRITDGRPISGGADGCLIIWDVQQGRPARRHQAHEASVTALATRPDGTVISGSADGTIAFWNPVTGESRPLAHHNAEVQGIAVRDNLIVTWGGSIRFWDADRQPALLAHEMAPELGRIQDLVLGRQTFTTLGQDGIARRQPIPEAVLNPSEASDRSDLGALAVRNRTAYLGLGTELIAVGLDTDGNEGSSALAIPFDRRPAQLVITDERLVVLDEDDQLWRVDLGRGNGEIHEVSADRVHHIHEVVPTAPGASNFVAAIGSNLRFNHRSEGPLVFGTWVRLRGDVTCLGSAGPGLIAAGLADGTVSVISPDRRDPKVVDLPASRSSPDVLLTTITVLDSGEIVTGSESGEIRLMDSANERVPQLAARRSGVTAIVAAQSWIVVGDARGYVSLWWSRPLRLVHEIAVGDPVTALAAEGTLIVARTVHGTVQIFDLDEEPDPALSELLTEALSATLVESDSGEPVLLAIDIVDDAMAEEYGYQVVAVRVFEDNDRPLEVQQAGSRPVGLDGLLDLPLRPELGEEWRIDVLPFRRPRTPLPGRPSSEPPMPALVVELDLVSRALAGYARTVRIPVDVTSPEGPP